MFLGWLNRMYGKKNFQIINKMDGKFEIEVMLI